MLIPSGVTSSQFRPLPRRPGERKFIATSGPMEGRTVTEWTVRQIRAQEQGFATPRQISTAYASPVWRSIVEKVAAHRGVSLDEAASDRELNDAFHRAFIQGERKGQTRTWDEAEEHDAQAMGYLLWQEGSITEAVYYRYFASRGGIT